MAPTCTLDVIIKNPQQRYTNNERINGEVVVEALRDLTVERVVVKCRCESTVSAEIPGKANTHDSFKHYSHERILFPSDRGQSLISDSSGALSEVDHANASSTVLRKGRHRFGFSFLLPADVTLPETFKCTGNGVEGAITWEIKAIVYRRKVFSVDITASRRFWFLPFAIAGAPVLDGEHTPRRQLVHFPAQDLGKNAPGITWINRAFSRTNQSFFVFCQMSFFEAGIQQPPNDSGIEVELRTDRDGAMTLHHISLSIRAATKVYVNGFNTVIENRAPLLKLHPNARIGTEPLTLSELLGEHRRLVLPHPIYGSFDTLHFEHRYTLLVEVAISLSSEPKHFYSRRFECPITAPPLGAVAIPPEDFDEDTLEWRSVVPRAPSMPSRAPSMSSMKLHMKERQVRAK